MIPIRKEKKKNKGKYFIDCMTVTLKYPVYDLHLQQLDVISN